MRQSGRVASLVYYAHLTGLNSGKDYFIGMTNFSKSIFPFLFFILAGSVNAQNNQKKQVQNELEKQLFPAPKLPTDFKFDFPGVFQEKWILTDDGVRLNALHFAAKKSRGVILYLHGSNDALDKWGRIASVYTNRNYDFFIPDYRGYGKSEGTISSEKQLNRDMQRIYENLKSDYPEKHIIIIGQSIGSGPAAVLAAENKPKKLVLQAPYYSLTDWIRNVVPDLDTTLIRYKFETYQSIRKVTAPIVLIHGDADSAVYYGSSQKLKAFLKPGDKLITLSGEGHTDFTKNKVYLARLRTVLK